MMTFLGGFTTFEGIDQSGKSTQLILLTEHIKEAGFKTLVVREPGGTPLGEDIREMLLGPEHTQMDPWAEAFLYASARAQLVKDVIRPALGRGEMVFSDRYFDSSLIYQGMARGLGVQKIYDLNMRVTNNLLPDLTLVLHLSVEDSRRRQGKSGDVPDRIESEPYEFHRMVEDGYRELEEMFPDRIVGIDGNGSIEEVHARIIPICNERLGLSLKTP